MPDRENRFKLRQIALVARELAPVERALAAVFGTRVAFRDPAVGKYGLENIVMPFGNQFLEVVAPVRPDTTAGRYLDRRGGDGGYMVILQCADPRDRDARVEALGIRRVGTIDYDDYDGLQLHPRDTGGSFLEIDWAPGFDRADGDWHPAGPDWRAARRPDSVAGIAAAEIQSPEPAALAARWGRLLGGDGSRDIRLEHGAIRFVDAADGRGEGLGGVDLLVPDPRPILDRAEALGLPVTGNRLLLAGMRFTLLSP
ncbi:MAG: hypothetical protein GC201_13870 [Alphaproteobacteria bacterium]|nr:hypothetical protein [Alphaproteobacteria bacterium]